MIMLVMCGIGGGVVDVVAGSGVGSVGGVVVLMLVVVVLVVLLLVLLVVSVVWLYWLGGGCGGGNHYCLLFSAIVFFREQAGFDSETDPDAGPVAMFRFPRPCMTY